MSKNYGKVALKREKVEFETGPDPFAKGPVLRDETYRFTVVGIK